MVDQIDKKGMVNKNSKKYLNYLWLSIDMNVSLSFEEITISCVYDSEWILYFRVYQIFSNLNSLNYLSLEYFLECYPIEERIIYLHFSLNAFDIEWIMKIYLNFNYVTESKLGYDMIP